MEEWGMKKSFLLLSFFFPLPSSLFLLPSSFFFLFSKIQAPKQEAIGAFSTNSKARQK
ncbi:MAG: hypothetical protein ACRC62_21585 [Microcoleus sp.]